MLLDGKRLLITGVLTEQSIAFSVARLAQEQGASVVLTGFGRSLSLTNRIARRLPLPAPVIELDVTSEDDLSLLSKRVLKHVDGLDGVLHAIGFAPADVLGSGVLDTSWESVSTALHVSTWSYAALARAALPILESANRYVARDLGTSGVRANLISAGPLKTMAAKSIPGFARFEDAWEERAPLGWDVTDPEPVAKACVALFSDLFPATTGSIIYVDGGFSAIDV